ncbi:DUF1178 family protein [Loktanella sp. SALINAS62]|uniref:DUF1178 family protein n=1 Tax=Loktanella sp. SALINAS62 TaxID=2706124 RepID=UPI001B8AC88C|nr:DUF1178 family protein [Loktanella sp. SALINAS62]
MIRYNLICNKDHSFDSWFASAAAYESLSQAGHLSCTICGSGEIRKALMAPKVKSAPVEPHPLEKLRKHVEGTATYVGGSFAKQARAQHDGTAPDRPIYGEATRAEVRDLLRDDIPVLPLPFRPKSQTN